MDDLESVTGELETRLREPLGQGVGESEVLQKLDELRGEVAGKDAGARALRRLFRCESFPKSWNIALM